MRSNDEGEVGEPSAEARREEFIQNNVKLPLGLRTGTEKELILSTGREGGLGRC
jgi:hypothetical protein